MLSKLILYIMGWEKLDYCGELNNYEHIICVFSHTSYYDFIMMLLYKFGYPDKLNNLKILIKPDYFQYIGSFLNYIGGIPSTNIASKNGGATERIVNILKMQPCKFLISPKGTILKGEWRTGYYHIAQKLNAPLIAIGLDYEKKNIFIGNLIHNNQKESTIKRLLYAELSNIVPLHKDQENMEIREHNEANVSVISSMRLITVTIISVFSIGTLYYLKIY